MITMTRNKNATKAEKRERKNAHTNNRKPTTNKYRMSEKKRMFNMSERMNE